MSGYSRVVGLAALAGGGWGLAFDIANDPAADVLLSVGGVALFWGIIVLPITVGVRALRARRAVLRPVLFTTAAFCAGAIPALFVVLGVGDLLGAFDQLRALDFGQPLGGSRTGIDLAGSMSAGLLVGASFYAAIVVVIVALLQRQPHRRPSPD